MRIAVALPSLEAGTPLRRSIDATFAALAANGFDVEGFAEHDRLESDGRFSVFHYLRLRERHTATPFDLAVYPLGRDASPYQGVFAMMSAFPGVVWFVDSVIHHLAVGGVALLDKWADYRGLLDDAYGDAGAAIAQTVASYWGTGALFRRYDLVAAVAGSQGGVLAAWPSLADRVSARLDGTAVGVVPLGKVEPPSVLAGSGAEAGLGDVAVMTVNESYPRSAIEAAAAVLAVEPSARVTVCLSEPIYKAEGLRAARHLGIDDRISWELTSSPRRLAEVASAAGVVLWLAEELLGAHRMLLLEGMAAGKMTVVADCPLYDDLPLGAVAKVELGRSLGAAVEHTLRRLGNDAALAAGLSDNGSAFAAERPDTNAAATQLADELRRLAAHCVPRHVDLTGPTWGRVAGTLHEAALPGGADERVRRAIEALLDAQTTAAREPRRSDE